MQIFAHTATQMVILFLLIGAGVIARRVHIMNDSFDTLLSKLVMNFSMPALILSSVLSSTELPQPPTIGMILGFGAVSFALAIVIAYAVPRLYRKVTGRERGAHSFVIAFGNVGFIGFPVLMVVLGPQSVLYGAIFNILYNLSVFTVGIAMLKGGKDQQDGGTYAAKPTGKHLLRQLWKNVANPCMAACVIAPVLALCGVTDNAGIVGQTCETLGQLTVPASMMVIGSTLGKMSVRDMVGHVLPYITSAMRLLVVPVVMFLVFRLFVSDPLVLGVIVLESAMPAASLGTMLSLIYGGDIDTIMRCTFISTLLSLVTIPLVAMLVV